MPPRRFAAPCTAPCTAPCAAPCAAPCVAPCAALFIALFVALFTLLVGGCASTTPGGAASAVAVQPVEIGGRFALSFTDPTADRKSENATGTFELYRDADRLNVDLSSPLGQTIAKAEHIRGRPAVLTTNDGRRFEGATLDDVFERAIGIRIPAEKLPDWLSDRFATVLERAPDGSRIRATDSGWQIDRRGRRWDLAWQQGSRRIEVRLISDR